MKYCNSCWNAATDDSLTVCPYCNTPYPPTQGDSKKKKKTAGGKKIPLIAAAMGGIALIALVAFLVVNLFGGNVISAAAENSVSSLLEHLGPRSDLFSYMQNMDSLNSKSDCQVFFAVGTPDMFFAVDANYAGSKKLIDGTFEFQITEDISAISMDFQANQKEVRLYAPDLVSDVYGFRFSDLQKSYEKSPLRKLLNLPSAKNLKLKPFQSFKPDKFMKDLCGNSWTAFAESVKTEKFDTRQITLGSRSEECTIYRIQWDANKAKALIQQLSKKTFGSIPKSVTDLISDLSPSIRCYVDSNDTLVGVEFTFLDSVYTFLLEGVSNPWEQFSLEISSVALGTKRYTGGVISDESGIRFELKDNSETIYAIYYDHNTSTYSVVTPDGEFINGIFRSGSTGFYLDSHFEDVSYYFSLSDAESHPTKDTSKYIDLLNMSLGDTTRMATELSSNLGVTLESLIELVGSIFSN